MFRKYFKRIFSEEHEKTGLNGYVYEFPVDYNIVDASNIIDIRQYLMKSMI